MRLALVAMLLLTLAGCRWKGMNDRPTLGGRGGGATPSGGAVSAGSLTEKTVTAKQEPATIIAFDGSVCVVTEGRFRETVIGEKVWCVWSPAK